MKNTNIYKRYRFPSEIIQYAVWLYYRFNLSYRDIEDLLAERGINVSYEAIRLWCNRKRKKNAAPLMRSSSGLMVNNITCGEQLTKTERLLMCIFRNGEMVR